MGQWELASNWSANSVPSNFGATTYAVTVAGPGAQASLVLLSATVQVATLATQPSNTVQVASFGTLAISGGSVANNGAVALAGVDGLATLRLDADATLAGSGVLVGGIDGSNRVLGNAGSVRLTNAAGHTIAGSMLLGANQLRLTNAGTIEADAGFGITMDLSDTGTHFNTGTMRTSAPTLLRVQNTVLDNSGGVIEAAGGGQVHLISSTILGGTIRDADGDGPSLITFGGTSMLDSLSCEGILAVPEGQTLRIGGEIIAPDGLELRGEGPQTNLVVDAAEATLSGGCVLSTFSSLQNRIYGTSPFNRLVLAPGSSFRGSGQLGVQSLTLINHGLIEADGFHDLIIALPGGVGSMNDGIIRCGSDRTLRMVQTELDNTGGLITTEGTGILTLDGASITGGTLRAVLGGTFTLDGGGVDGVTLVGDGTPGSGEFIVTGGSPLNQSPLFRNATFTPGVSLDGARVRMSGTVHFEGPMNIASPRVRVPAEGLTLAGPGPTNVGGASEGSFAFEEAGSELTIAAEHSMVFPSGSGSFGGVAIWNGNVPANVMNRGSMTPGFSLALGSGGVFTNDGSVTVTSGNHVSIDGLYGDEPIEFIQRDGTLTLNGTFLSRYWEPGPESTWTSVTGLSDLSVEGGTLRGTGSAVGRLIAVGGVIAPGSQGNGAFVVNPPELPVPGQPIYQQVDGATLQVTFGQPPSSGGTSLVVNGPVSLGGTLEVLVPGPTEPQVGAEHVVLTCTGSISGEFTSVICALPVEVEYQSGAVIVRVIERGGIVGDLNGDGVVSGADLGALLAAWGACGEGACAADLNGDGSVSGADLGVLLSNWS